MEKVWGKLRVCRRGHRACLTAAVERAVFAAAAAIIHGKSFLKRQSSSRPGRPHFDISLLFGSGRLLNATYRLWAHDLEYYYVSMYQLGYIFNNRSVTTLLSKGFRDPMQGKDSKWVIWLSYLSAEGNMPLFV